jgi:hypothetical protein
MTKTFKLTISRTGIPCLWEGGGGYTNTGSATIIAGKDGEKKAPLYIRQRGPLACAHHALIPVDVGDYIISTNHHRGDFETQICRVEEIQAETAVCSIIGEYSRGEWVFSTELRPGVTDRLIPAVDAAWEKATCYHCRWPHYVA